MPFLTIAIPTFNRLRWLSYTLPAILEQAKEFPAGDIEVLVSDNCSSDGTWAYLQELAQRITFLRLNRNEVNIGSEANFYLLPQLATGRYLWMIGDDDLVNPGALKRIVDALREEPDYLALNYDVYEPRMEIRVRENYLNALSDEVLTTQDDCPPRIDAMSTGFISMWVGRREFFNTITQEKYYYFAKWGMSIQADRYFGRKQFPNGRLISMPCLRMRQEASFNEQLYFSCFLQGSVEVFRYTDEMGVLSKATIRKLKSLLLHRNALQRIRFQRRKGIFNRAETFKLLRAGYGDLPEFWLLCVPVMFMPGVGTLLNIGRQLLGRTDPRPEADL